MAHSTLHFSVGIVAGSAFALPGLLRAWIAGLPIARRFARWLLLSWALGVYAVIPGILRRSGVPEHVCDGWWMNVFLFHPLVHWLRPGAQTSGPLVLGACFAVQYALLLASIASRRKRGGPALTD